VTAAVKEARPIVCVNCNGVLDAYTRWRGPHHFDPPRAAARQFLEALVARGYGVVIFTTRFPDDVWRWLDEYGLRATVRHVTDRKRAAHVVIDDRALCFRGVFDCTLHQVDRFLAHWEADAGR
jgi:hypothetical protein